MLEIDWERMAKDAWSARSQARVLGNTTVGAAVLDAGGGLWSGCNIEHKFRCHDVHAEVNAISSMISSGAREIVAVLVVANRERFTPCGGCMDWIFEFGGPKVRVGFQREPGGDVEVLSAGELMPHYPH